MFQRSYARAFLGFGRRHHSKHQGVCSGSWMCDKSQLICHSVNPGLTNPWLINRGCPLLVGIHHCGREHPPNSGTGLLVKIYPVLLSFLGTVRGENPLCVFRRSWRNCPWRVCSSEHLHGPWGSVLKLLVTCELLNHHVMWMDEIHFAPP